MGLDFSLEGKVALITGSGRGVGEGIAEVFLEAGATVVLNALTARYLEVTAERLRLAHGARVAAIVADVTTPDGAAGLRERALRVAGRVDVLVNSVGDGAFAPLVDTPSMAYPALAEADIKRLIDLNLMSAIYCARAFGPDLIASVAGRLILISSAAAIRALTGTSIYSAAKIGLTGFTRAMALEWAPHRVTVNAIAPGSFPDRRRPETSPAYFSDEEAVTRIPLGRHGDAREIGVLALYLASDAGGYMTGQLLALDGGHSL